MGGWICQSENKNFDVNTPTATLTLEVSFINWQIEAFEPNS